MFLNGIFIGKWGCWVGGTWESPLWSWSKRCPPTFSVPFLPRLPRHTAPGKKVLHWALSWSALSPVWAAVRQSALPLGPVSPRVLVLHPLTVPFDSHSSLPLQWHLLCVGGPLAHWTGMMQNVGLSKVENRNECNEPVTGVYLQHRWLLYFWQN